MTEKELAEKVWGAIDEWYMDLRHLYHLSDCSRRELQKHKLEGFQLASAIVEESLPRPKRKVKKEMWAKLYINGAMGISGSCGKIFRTKSDAEFAFGEGTITKVTFEVEE